MGDGLALAADQQMTLATDEAVDGRAPALANESTLRLLADRQQRKNEIQDIVVETDVEIGWRRSQSRDLGPLRPQKSRIHVKTSPKLIVCDGAVDVERRT